MGTTTAGVDDEADDEEDEGSLVRSLTCCNRSCCERVNDSKTCSSVSKSVMPLKKEIEGIMLSKIENHERKTLPCI